VLWHEARAAEAPFDNGAVPLDITEPREHGSSKESHLQGWANAPSEREAIMQDIGNYEVLSHVEMPECSIRIIGLRETESVASHYHEQSTQVYTVLERTVEARIGERTFRLRPYETVRIERNTVHSVRSVAGRALLFSLSIPPLSLEDQHVPQ
jgi:quercetin dioxygenase-like cupin family protein